MNEISKQIKKGIIIGIIFTLIGIISFLLNLYLHQKILSGIVFGFLPVGIGYILIYTFGKNSIKLRNNIKIENEERNIFIAMKSGYFSFWVSFWLVFILFVTIQFINISTSDFAFVLLVLFPIIYFSNLILFHKKY